MHEPSLLDNVLMDVAAGKIVPLRQRIMAFEEQARRAPQVTLQVFHHFSPGIYMRELHVPAGIITTGKIHKHQCLNVLAKGRRRTVVDGRLQDIMAPHIHLSPAGSKRISYTIEDSVWITVHQNPDNCRVVETLEKRYVCETEEEYQAFLAESERLKCLS